MKNKKIQKWLVGSIIFFAGVEIVYLVVGNLLLGGVFLPQFLNRDPETLSIEWSSGWTAFPGHVNLKDLKIRGQTEDRRFELSMARAAGHVALSRLLFKTLKLYSLDAGDISATVRNAGSRSGTTDPGAGDTALAPRQSQLATAPERSESAESTADSEPSDATPGWKIDIGNAGIEGLRALEFDEYRFAGEGHAQLDDLSFQIRGPVEVDRATLQLLSGELSVGPEPIAQDLQADADIQVDAFVPSENPGAQAAQFVSGSIGMAGEIGSFGFINHYLSEAGWLQLQGRGHLSGTLQVETGRVMEGSELVIDSSQMIVDLDERKATGQGERYQVKGAGTVRGNVQTKEEVQEAQLQVALHDITMEQIGLDQEFLRGKSFQLTASAPSLDLGAVPLTEPALVMEWRLAEMPDVAVLNRFFPEGLPFSLDAGSARLSGHFKYADRRVSGAFNLAGEQITGAVLNEPVVGQMGVKLNLNEIDLENRPLDLSGTHFELQAAADKTRKTALRTELDIQEARLESALPWDELKQHSGPLPISGALKMEGVVANVDFLNNFFPSEQGFKFGGDGRVTADLKLHMGQLAPGSALKIKSDRLEGRFLDFRVRGKGEVRGDVFSVVGEGTQETLLWVELKDMEMRKNPGDKLFLRAKGFQMNATTTSLALSEGPVEPVITMGWQEAVMPDVAVLNAYFPGRPPFRLNSGSAQLNGRLDYANRNVSGKLNLAGNKIAGTLFKKPVVGGLGVNLVIAEANLDTRRLDLSGTRIRMQAASAGGKAPLKTELDIPVARLESALSWEDLKQRREQAPVSGVLKLDGRVANIGFLNGFLPGEQGVEFGGDGRMTADLRIARGQLAPGSQLEVKSANLASRFLDFEASGSGLLTAAVEGKPRTPTGKIEVFLLDFGLRRLRDKTPYVKGRNFEIVTVGKNFDLDNGIKDLDTVIKLSSAEIPDLSIYNAYLPKNAGVAIVSGKGVIKANFEFSGASGGNLAIEGRGVEIAIKDQIIKGKLLIDTRLKNGNLENKSFDVSGTQVKIENGFLKTKGGVQDQWWWGEINLERGKMIWKQPLDLDAKVGLKLRDSGLLVHLFVKAAQDREWLDDLLTIRDVSGQSEVTINDKTITLKNTKITGEKLLVLSNLRLRDKKMNGGLYAKYGIFGLGVELRDGEQKLKILNPRKWYDDYARRFAKQP